MSGLKELSIKGYRSRRSQKLALDPPTKTVWGSQARQLPIRARTMGLRRLRLEDSSFSEEDLVALVRHITPGSLIELVVEEVYHVEAVEDADGFWATDDDEGAEWTTDQSRNPTTLHLDKVLLLVAGSLRRLQVGLWNYPIITRAAPLPTSLSPRPSTNTSSAPSFAEHHLDPHLSHLTSLESLDLGGTCCTSKVLEHLPLTVTRLSVRGCPALEAKGVSSWLRELAQRRKDWGIKIPTLSPPRSRITPLKPTTSPPVHRTHAAPQPPLRRKPFTSLSLSKPSTSSPEAGWEALPVLRWLTVSGGSPAGWSDPQESWEVQKACWLAGVVWRGPGVVGGGMGVGAAGGAW
jgi:hypothetical protein